MTQHVKLDLDRLMPLLGKNGGSVLVERVRPDGNQLELGPVTATLFNHPPIAVEAEVTSLEGLNVLLTVPHQKERAA